MKTGIIGFGKMGRNIFSLFSDAGGAVAVYEYNPAKVEQQKQRVEKRLRRSLRSGLLTEAEFDAQQKALTFTTDISDLSDCDLIIEAIVEDFPAKVEVLRRIESLVSPDAVITSNTSSLSINELGSALKHRERFCGLHFFHPVQLTTVVEIIRSEQTSDATVGMLREICHGLQKRPLVVKDLPGSCINVPLTFQICESLYIMEQGLALPSRIDAIADTIVRVGPCISVDIVGLPLVFATTERALHSLHTSFSLADLGHRLIADGRHGKARNRGIYLYREDRPVDDSPDYYRNPGQTHSRDGQSDDDSLLERIIAPVYYSVLLMAQMGLGSLEDLCAGIADVIGLKFDPFEKMKALGSPGMKELFERLSGQLGPRYDWRPLEDILSTLDESGVSTD